MRKTLFIIITVFSVLFFVEAEEKKSVAVKQAISIQNAFAEVAEKALPAVVIVKTAKKIKQYFYVYPRSDRNSNRFNRRFFRGPHILEKESDEPIPSGQASGFIINEDGYIITNYHVIKDQSDFKIKFFNGEEHEAKIIGFDAETDIAVLKIDVKKKLPYLEFADPKSVKVGHYTISIGAPFGLEHTVTSGIVSFKGRSAGMNLYENYIQTDAAINPGNSGGPLLNLDGKVIGVNDFILSPPGSSGNIGLGFAISGKLAQKVAKQIISTGKAEKAWIGIVMQSIPKDIAEKQKLRNGVFVNALFKGGSAHKAGIRIGDIVTKIGDTDIADPEDLTQSILNHLPGDKIKITLTRSSQEQVLDVELGSRPSAEIFNTSSWISE
jgi:serine protease Do